MPSEVQTCPKCGAMITPNLIRCRQCKTFLQGTRIEGALFDGLLPESLSQGTGLMAAFLFVYYVVMVMFAGPDSALGLSPYAIRQLGGVDSIGIFQGEYWRFATGMLGHAGVFHLVFNMYALTVVGPLIEELFDRKKMLVIFIVGGVLAMVASHVWTVQLMGRPVHMTIGASGGTSALIGACYIGARRKGPGGQEIAQIMFNWSAYMVLLGFAVSGIDNAAHIGGWLLGAGFAAAFPLGPTPTVTQNRMYSVLILLLLGGLVASWGFMLADVRSYGARLDADFWPRRILFFTYAEGEKWDYSSQNLLLQKCEKSWQTAMTSRDAGTAAIETCERARRAWSAPLPHVALADLYAKQGDAQKALQHRRVLEHFR